MPIEELTGEVVGAAIEFAGEAARQAAEPPKRDASLRWLYRLAVVSIVGGVIAVLYVQLP